MTVKIKLYSNITTIYYPAITKFIKYPFKSTNTNYIEVKNAKTDQKIMTIAIAYFRSFPTELQT